MPKYYTGKGIQSKDRQAASLPVPQTEKLRNPQYYIADSGLVDACNVAILLGKPILLTGAPGTGKTQFAYSLAWELGLSGPFKFETKSTSTAKDLFYSFDALRRFYDAHRGSNDIGGNQELKNSQTHVDVTLSYLTFNALGKAILLSRSRTEDGIKDIWPSEFKDSGHQRSVVLIDEVDKAPRDFPNDILNELELLYFRIPELGNREVKANAEFPPIVICTSNSEKDLPDAFLRRCLYYHIPFPERERLTQIISNRIGIHIREDNSFAKALDFFYRLRNPSLGLRKPPSTAELLDWLMALQGLSNDEANPLNEPKIVLRTLCNLVKNQEDQRRAKEEAKAWLNQWSSKP
ncbi:MAG: MoxR family ATPase [Chloroflexota bacterium]